MNIHMNIITDMNELKSAISDERVLRSQSLSSTQSNMTMEHVR